ncbi:MAG: DsbA family oxidoreductase [Rhodobacteraceae bacterium]|nr:MAG: DsbA family oxidoreductase [Paracoccaceae bacterium]
MIRLDIFSDPVCPWCFIGKHNLFTALSGVDEELFSIEWHPFQLNPNMPEGGMDRREYLETKFGGKEGAIQAYLPIVEHANATGLTINFEAITKTPNTLKAQCLINWAKLEGCQNELIQALFEAYFCHGKDIGDTAVLIDIAAQSGMNADVVKRLFASGQDQLEMQERDASARNMGVRAVPTFIVAGQHVVSGAQSVEMWQSVIEDIQKQLESQSPEMGRFG